jgi:hypothetical protein
MPTVAHCRKRARELTALAETDPQNRAEHLNAAVMWSLVAARMEDLEAATAGCFAAA